MSPSYYLTKILLIKTMKAMFLDNCTAAWETDKSGAWPEEEERSASPSQREAAISITPDKRAHPPASSPFALRDPEVTVLFMLLGRSLF